MAGRQREKSLIRISHVVLTYLPPNSLRNSSHGSLSPSIRRSHDCDGHIATISIQVTSAVPEDNSLRQSCIDQSLSTYSRGPGLQNRLVVCATWSSVVFGDGAYRFAATLGSNTPRRVDWPPTHTECVVVVAAAATFTVNCTEYPPRELWAVYSLRTQHTPTLHSWPVFNSHGPDASTY